MSQNQEDLNSQPTNSPAPSGFLGGGPKFNQAGLNTPMAGEKTADVPPPPPFGGPRVWIATVVIICVLILLYVQFGDNMLGTRHVGGRGGGLSASDRPVVDSDHPSGQ
jgi:hypothetical protein